MTTPIEPAPLGEGAGTSPTPQGSTGLGWWAGAVAAALALAAVAFAAWLLVRRRGARGQASLAAPEPATVPIPVAPAPAPEAAKLTLNFSPNRAGVNLLSATVTGEVTVRNASPVPATRVQVEATLIGAHVEQDAELRAIHTGPLGRLATPPFTLQPGEERQVAVVAVLPHEAIRPIEAAGRPMFVPLVAITAAFEDADGAHRAGRSFAVGIERVDSAKLAPIWLDGPPRMHDQVAARAHGDAFAA